MSMSAKTACHMTEMVHRERTDRILAGPSGPTRKADFQIHSLSPTHAHRTFARSPEKLRFWNIPCFTSQTL